MDRRLLLKCGLGIAAFQSARLLPGPPTEYWGSLPPAYSLIPVVGDGRWVWTEPPQQTGYLEPRKFRASIGIELEGTSSAQQIRATTPIPVALPEQKIDSVEKEAVGCQVSLRQLTSEAGQLCLFAPSLARGQTIRATAHFDLTLFKQYHGFSQEQFPSVQQVPRPVRQRYLNDSPGIKASDRAVRELARDLSGQFEHPWEKAKSFYQWVWSEIAPQVQYFTSVAAALRDRVGDCEERAAVFVAFCRAVGIPARLVWVPNHNWAEFYLQDHEGQGHWIPAHTSAYSWFGWTGVHELVLQKGDRIQVPERRQPQRLLVDWMQFRGRRPRVRYTADLQPVSSEANADAGPGGRSKDAKGEWIVTGTHRLDSELRDAKG